MMGKETEELGQQVGRELRSARAERGISLEEVEQATNIHSRHLQALEEGDFDLLPSHAWARGFLITYGNYLRLEGEELADKVFPLQRPPRPVRYVKHRWRGLVAALCALAAAAIAAFSIAIVAPYSPIGKEINDALNRIAPGYFAESGPQRLVVLGFTDSQALGSDNVLAAKIAQDGVGVLSIPGNTLAEIPGHGEGEIGDASALGGPDLTRQTVARLAGTEIPYYLAISPEGIADVVDTMGGVRIDVPEPVSGRSTPGGPQLTLRQGPQTLDGDKALVYLQGKDLSTDVQQAERQQHFLFETYRQALTPKTLIFRPTTLRTLLERTQTNMSLAEALQLASRTRALKESGEGIEAGALPGRKKGVDGGRATGTVDYWVPDTRALSGVLRKTMR